MGEEKEVMAEDNQEEQVVEDNRLEEGEEEQVEEDTGRCAKASGPFGWPKDDDQSLRT